MSYAPRLDYFRCRHQGTIVERALLLRHSLVALDSLSFALSLMLSVSLTRSKPPAPDRSQTLFSTVAVKIFFNFLSTSFSVALLVNVTSVPTFGCVLDVVAVAIGFTLRYFQVRPRG